MSTDPRDILIGAALALLLFLVLGPLLLPRRP